MTFEIDISPAIKDALAAGGRSPEAELKEAALVELYRQLRISHGQFAEALGIARHEADAILKRHNVTEDLVTPEELDEQVARLRELLP